MKQEQGTEKMDVVNDNSIAVNKPLTSDDVRQIRRTRLILLILIGICFGFAVAGFMSTICIWSNETCVIMIDQIFIALLIVIYYGYGLVVTYRYYPDGLRAIVCIGFMLLYVSGVVSIGLVFPTRMRKGVWDIRRAAIEFIVYFNVMVFVVKFSIDLIRLLDPDGLLRL